MKCNNLKFSLEYERNISNKSLTSMLLGTNKMRAWSSKCEDLFIKNT